MIDEDTFLTSGFSGPERLPTEAPTPQRGFDLSSLGDLGAQIMSLGPLADIANVLNAVGEGSDEFLALVNRRLAQSALPDVEHDFPVGPMTAAQADPATRGELEYMQTPEARKAQAGSLERRTREKRGHVPGALVYELESNIGSSLSANSRLQMMTSLENLMALVDTEGTKFQQTDPDDDRGLEQHMADTLAGGMQHIMNFYGNPLKQGLVAGVADPLNILDLIDPFGGPAVPLLASFRAMGKLNQRLAQVALRVIKKRAQRGKLLTPPTAEEWGTLPTPLHPSRSVEYPMHELMIERAEDVGTVVGTPPGFTRRTMLELAQDVVNNPERHLANRIDFESQIARLEEMHDLDGVKIKDHEDKVLSWDLRPPDVVTGDLWPDVVKPKYYHGARGMPLEGLVGTYIDPITKDLHLKPSSNPSEGGLGEYRAVSVFEENEFGGGRTDALRYAQQGPTRWTGDYNPGGDGVVFEIDASYANKNYTVTDQSDRLAGEMSMYPKGVPPFDRDYEIVIPAGSYNIILPEGHAWGIWNDVKQMDTASLWYHYLDMNWKPREVLGDESFLTSIPIPNQTKLRAITAELAHRMDEEFGLTQHLEGVSRQDIPVERLDPKDLKPPEFAEVIRQRDRRAVKNSVRQVILDMFENREVGGPSYFNPEYHFPPEERRLSKTGLGPTNRFGISPMDQLREWRDNPDAFAKLFIEKGINPLKPRQTITQPAIGRDPVMVLGDRTFLKEYFTPELVTEVIDDLIREWRVDVKSGARRSDISDKQEAMMTVLEGLAKDNPSINRQKAYESVRDLPLKELKKKAAPYLLRSYQESAIPELLENYVKLRRNRQDEFPIDLPAEEARLRAMSHRELVEEYNNEITYYLYDDVSDDPPVDRLTGKYILD